MSGAGPPKRPREGHVESLVSENDLAQQQKKAARLAKLAMWKANKAAAEASHEAPKEGNATAGQEADIDPLDAFMSHEVLPEIQRKQEEERCKEQEERRQLEEALRKGHVPKALKELLADDAPDAALAAADMEMTIPGKMLKRLMGVGGETIRHITKTSGCKIQVKKGEKAMALGFGSTMQERVEAHLSDSQTVTLELRGSQKSCEEAKEMVLNAVDSKLERERKRARAKEKKEEQERTKARIYRLRHANDFEILEIAPTASKEEMKQAYRRLAMAWHPDKNPERREEAEQMFQKVDRAYKNLMNDE
jgi:hypothetical protein